MIFLVFHFLFCPGLQRFCLVFFGSQQNQPIGAETVFRKRNNASSWNQRDLSPALWLSLSLLFLSVSCSPFSPQKPFSYFLYLFAPLSPVLTLFFVSPSVSGFLQSLSAYAHVPLLCHSLISLRETTLSFFIHFEQQLSLPSRAKKSRKGVLCLNLSVPFWRCFFACPEHRSLILSVKAQCFSLQAVVKPRPAKKDVKEHSAVSGPCCSLYGYVCRFFFLPKSKRILFSLQAAGEPCRRRNK